MHTVVPSAASVNDKCHFDDLLHGEETVVWADRGYDYPDIAGAAPSAGNSSALPFARRLVSHAGRWIARLIT
ncbi:hypothetical protein [Derxia gummosa]|uniref:Uncharacterized protein n=1 Tax=Derxia gummosa DSM 723 TaxID=1121388 RepID=A0AC36KLJ8_9BURK